MSEVARYYHTSLYAFNPQARSAVISTFNEVVQDVAVRCWYDGAQETFLVECPTALGSLADEALTAIVKKYIDTELDDSEIEEREPNVLRFPESRFDALDSFIETQNPTEGEDHRISAAPIISGRPSVTHLMIVGTAEGRSLKFFRLDQLPDDLLERTLAPCSERAQRVVNGGLTCRAVRWNDETGRHVFNGRTGTDRAVTTVLMDELKMPEFHRLHDTRTLEAASRPTATWVHAGAAPTVEKWVRGIGETRQHDPEEKAEMPKDARNLIAAANSYAIGRARVPKGGQIIDDDSDTEVSGDRRPSANAFNSLLNGEIAGISGSDDSNSDEAEDSAEPAFADLLGPSGSKQVATSTRQSIAGDWNMLVKPASARTSVVARLSASAKQPQAEYSPTPHPLPRQRAMTKTSQDAAIRRERASTRDEDSSPSFPSYGKDFAGVDFLGLHAPPAAAARWQNEHYEDKKTRSKHRAIALREIEVSGSGSLPSSDKSDSGERDSKIRTRGTEAESSALASSSTLDSAPAQPDADWINAVVQPRVRQGRLVDDRYQFSDRLPDAPPGFHAFEIAPSKREAEAAVTGFTTSASQLIDVVGNVLEEVPTQPPATMPGSLQRPLVPTPSISLHAAHQSHQSNHADAAEDVIMERVQTLPASYTTKRNTMRQKARNKAKKAPKIGGKSTAKKVELPLPSPPPPPKPKPAPDHQTKQQKLHIRQTVSQSHDASARAPAAPSASSITSGTHSFGQALLDLRQYVASLLDDVEADVDVETVQPAVPAKLSCQVGIVLLRGLDKALSKHTLEPETLQHKLNDSSANIKRDLFGRVTTSTADAKAVMEIMNKGDGQIVAGAEYSMVIRDDAGAFLTVTVPADDKESYTIKSQAQVSTEACAHFPTRVWDARYTLLQPASEVDTPASKAIKEFVASMQTVDDAPSFRAMVSNAVFTLERVQIKRAFSQTTDDITAKVVQVQDLIMEPVDLKHHNIQAIALPEERMTEEQRLWWEASWETARLDLAEELQARVNEAICSMDHIGSDNQGPWVRLEESDEEERSAVPSDTILW